MPPASSHRRPARARDLPDVRSGSGRPAATAGSSRCRGAPRDLGGNRKAARLELRLIGIALRHAHGDAVGREHQHRLAARRGRELRYRGEHMVRGGVDEAGRQVPVADVGDLHVREPGVAQRLSRLGDVLAILRAARIAAMRGRDHADGPAYAVPRHLRQRVPQIRMPVAHADIHRQRVAPRRERRAQSPRLPVRQVGDRGHPVEQLVVVRDFLDPLGRHPPSAQDVGEKGSNISRTLRSAEGDQEHSVELGWHCPDYRSTLARGVIRRCCRLSVRQLRRPKTAPPRTPSTPRTLAGRNTCWLVRLPTRSAFAVLAPFAVSLLTGSGCHRPSRPADIVIP